MSDQFDDAPDDPSSHFAAPRLPGTAFIDDDAHLPSNPPSTALPAPVYDDFEVDENEEENEDEDYVWDEDEEGSGDEYVRMREVNDEDWDGAERSTFSSCPLEPLGTPNLENLKPPYRFLQAVQPPEAVPLRHLWQLVRQRHLQDIHPTLHDLRPSPRPQPTFPAGLEAEIQTDVVEPDGSSG